MKSYELLKTIYEISKQDPVPEKYPCKPRELILRLMQDWSAIQQSLTDLENENLIRTVQQDTLVITITKDGIQKVNELNLLAKED